MSKVFAIIVNFHQERLSERAIASVLASAGVEARVVLVDSESDGRWARGRYAGHPRVEVLYNTANAGHGAACNQGIERALERGADFVLLLASTVTVEPDCLARLAEAAAEGGGLAAPKILLTDGRIYAAGGLMELGRGRCRNRGQHEADRGQYDRPEELAFAPAVALLIARRALEGSARIFEPYFLSYQDADFCLLLAGAGRLLRYVPQARAVHHLEAAATGKRAAGLLYYELRNRLVFISRHGHGKTRTLGLGYVVAAGLARAGAGLLRGHRHEAAACLSALRDFQRRRLGRRSG